MRFLQLVAVVLALAAVSACSDSAKPNASASASSAPDPSNASTAGTPDAVASCTRPHPPGQTAETFDFEGQARTFQLYVPKTYDGTKPVPVVFNFHGFGSNAVEQMLYANFMPLADRDGFLVVAPDGQGASRHFNLTGEQGLQDDVAMVGALLDKVEADFCVDAKRVFSTGMSAGGAMTSVLACRSGDRFAAFGAVAVIVFVPGCGGTNNIAITDFSGTEDPVVPFNGGPVKCCGGPTLGAAPDAMANWAAAEGCDPTFIDTVIGTEVTKRTWPNCRPGAEVVFYIINGGGHTWPGSIPIDRLGKTTTQIDATATIWDFFKAHPHP